MSICQVPLWVTQKNKSFLLRWICGNSSIHVQLVIMHCAERWILLSKMKYKLLCCFFNNFLNVKKHNYKTNPCQNFQFFSHTGPRYPFFEAFFVAAPPLIRKRGEKISERTLDRSWDDILVDTFGDCPTTTIWQIVIE